jgi:hypothetical protein
MATTGRRQALCHRPCLDPAAARGTRNQTTTVDRVCPKGRLAPIQGPCRRPSPMATTGRHPALCHRPCPCHAARPKAIRQRCMHSPTTMASPHLVPIQAPCRRPCRRPCPMATTAHQASTARCMRTGTTTEPRRQGRHRGPCPDPMGWGPIQGPCRRPCHRPWPKAIAVRRPALCHRPCPAVRAGLGPCLAQQSMRTPTTTASCSTTAGRCLAATTGPKAVASRRCDSHTSTTTASSCDRWFR